MSGSLRSSTTQSKGRLRSRSSASAPVPAVVMRDVVVRQQLDDAHLLARVVLDDQQLAHARHGERLEAVERGLEAVGRERLVEVGERAALEAVLALLLDGDDLHGDVARRGVALELAQHRPAEHVGQEDVEGDRGRRVPARQGQRFGARAARPAP